VALDLATAVVSITGDQAPLRHAISGAKAATDRGVNAMQAKLRKLGDTFMRVGKRMTAFVTLPIVGGFALITKAASDFEESSTMFDAVFKELKGEARAWSEDFAKSAGRSKAAVIGWMGSLQDTFVPLGIARKRAMELSQALVAHAVDVASFKNKLDVDVIHAFNRALTGEREMLKDLGIVILEADVKQEIMRQGWARTTKEITQQMKAEATFNLILARSTDAIGDNARTAGGLANQMKKLKGEWHDIAVDFGTILIPIAKDLVGVLSDVATWVKGLSPETKEWALGIAALAAAAGPVLIVFGAIMKLRMAAHVAQIVVQMHALSAAQAGVAVSGTAAHGSMLKMIGTKGGILAIAVAVGLVGQKIIEWRIGAMKKEREAISKTGVAAYNLEREARTGLKVGESQLAPKPGTPAALRTAQRTGPSETEPAPINLGRATRTGLGETGPAPKPGPGGLSKEDSDNLRLVAQSTKKTADEGGGLP